MMGPEMPEPEMTGFGAPDQQICSRAGCAEPATWNVNWRNPKIHTADRVKIWLACDEHRQYLFDYLATRSFPVKVTPLAEHIAFVPDPSSKSGPGAATGSTAADAP